MNWSHLKENTFYSAIDKKSKKKNKTNLRSLTFPGKFYTAQYIRTEMTLVSYACKIRLSNFVFDVIVGEMIRKLIIKLMNNLIDM